MTPSPKSTPANPNLFPNDKRVAVDGDTDILNSVGGTIRWLKTYGAPHLTEQERTHARRRLDGTYETTNLSVGVSIIVCKTQRIMQAGGECSVYMSLDGVEVSCWPGPLSETHHQLEYRARIPPEELSGTRAIRVDLNRDRTWIPDLGRQKRVFEPSINPVNMSEDCGPGHTRLPGPYGSALDLNANQSFTIIDFEMKLE